MVRVTGPMFSNDARGSVGKALTFSENHGVNYVRQLVKPTDPKTPPQISLRAMVAFLSVLWKSLSSSDQQTWISPAQAAGYSPFNAYIAANQARWALYQTPHVLWPLVASPVVLAAPIVVNFPEVAGIKLSIATLFPPDPWAVLIHRSLTDGFTPSQHTAVAAILTPTKPTQYVDAPLVTGVSYHYRVQQFNDAGSNGILTAQFTAVPL